MYIITMLNKAEKKKNLYLLSNFEAVKKFKVNIQKLKFGKQFQWHGMQL